MTNTLIFSSPAQRWEEALPLGNGRLGAMIFGSPDRERIQLNEDSIWSGNYRDRNNPAAKESLTEIRKLLNEGRAAEAEELCLECLSGTPPAQRVYQTAGELQISFSPDGGPFGHPWSGTRNSPLMKEVINYSRQLDISNAVHTISFEYGNILFKRECFISAVSGVLAIRFCAVNKDDTPAAGKISFRACLDRGVFSDRKGSIDTQQQGKAAFLCRDEDIPFCVMFKVEQKGGTQKCQGGFITVNNADEALLILDIQTGFRKPDYTEACLTNINLCMTNSWEKLLQEHVCEYQALYDRVDLEINNAEKAVKYFNFCRYLLISCSRPGNLPANLQGLWNQHIDPPWGSDYTININAQMNYWAACMCNLAETEEPLFDHLERMYPNGINTAKEIYGCRGFTAHHNTDIWGDAAPRDYWIPAVYWVLGAAWLSLHIWEHYEYTMDKTFLNKYYYLLKEACIFFVDFLTPGKKTNEAGQPFLVVSPSVSPENSYWQRTMNNEERERGDAASLCAGCEMDNSILRKLFDVTIRSAEILGIHDNETELFSSILTRIAKPVIHSNGTICEWNEEYEEAEPGHRHFSHLWSLWPGDYITPEETPELAAAAKKSLERRLAADGGHTGWSRAWLINFFARLKDGEAALENVNAMFNDFTLPNLFNDGPPFQIDGNFGALSGITQMIMQSRSRYNENEIRIELDLLPALPISWSDGHVKGLRAKGNLEVDIKWQDSKITSLAVTNKNSKPISVLLRGGGLEDRELVMDTGETK